MEIFFRNHSPWQTGLYAALIVVICGVIGHGNMDLRLPGGLQYVIFPTYLLGIFAFMRGTQPTDSEVLQVHLQIVASSAIAWFCIGYLFHVIYINKKNRITSTTIPYEEGIVPSKKHSTLEKVATLIVTGILIVIAFPVILFILEITGILDL